MNRDDIIRMAREAGFTDADDDCVWITDGTWDKELCKFAELIAAAEREACAVIAFNAKTYIEAAKAIRARGQG